MTTERVALTDTERQALIDAHARKNLFATYLTVEDIIAARVAEVLARLNAVALNESTVSAETRAMYSAIDSEIRRIRDDGGAE